MGFLNDIDIRNRAVPGPAQLIDGIKPSHLTIDIRGCAADLHIGAIFRPGIEAGNPGAADTPHKLPVTLEEGETALIQSVEMFKLDAEHAAFVFPASSVSIQGLLMTNPGHIDPGYEGPVHVTVINMGREPFTLQPNARFLRAFIYQLSAPAASPKAPGSATPVTQELLNKLSPDFMSVNERSVSAAKKEVASAVKSINIWQFAAPAIATVAAAVLGALLSTYRFEDRIKSLEDAKAVERLKALETNYPTEKRLMEIEAQLKQLPSGTAPRKSSLPSTPK